jgi:hypothetical protein
MPSQRRPRGNRAKHLVRVAAEYTQLLYHVSKAHSDTRSSFVDEIQWVCRLPLSSVLTPFDRPVLTENQPYTINLVIGP